jgi:regulator of nonsense transcripts 3
VSTAMLGPLLNESSLTPAHERLAKPPRTSTAHLNILDKNDVLSFIEHVRTVTWHDRRETWDHPDIPKPAYAEQSIYQKVPSSKKRVDPKQGTIDQDSDFQEFLALLTNPELASKAAGGSLAGGEGSSEAKDDDGETSEKPSITPLVAFLKDKKARLAAEKAANKTKHGRHESKGKATASAAANSSTTAVDDAASSKRKAKPKETVKILTKKAAAESAAEAANAVTSQLKASGSSASQSTANAGSSDSPAKSRRAGIAAAAKRLQKDLGLSPGMANRQARHDVAKAEAASKAAEAKDNGAASSAVANAADTSKALGVGPPGSSKDAQSTPSATPTGPKGEGSTNDRRSRGGRKQGLSSEASEAKSGSSAAPPNKAPVVLLRKREASQPKAAAAAASSAIPHNMPTGPAASDLPAAPIAATPTGPKAAQAPVTAISASHRKGGLGAIVSPGATRAFIKHANPSQGVTEALLKEAMEAFGGVAFVEIDRRKGFAYVDFADHDGLVKAVTASPVSVAQAAVQVLERKETPAAKRVAASAGNKTPATESAPRPPPSTPTGPAADQVQPGASGPGGSDKRGPRRRGRGRGGESASKENGSSASAAPNGASASGG